MSNDSRAGTGAAARWALRLVGALVAAYLLSPLLFSQHLEGYTANLRSISLAWGRGELATQDALMPLITEYLFSTRIGVVLLLRLIDSSFGEIGDAGFRGLTIASFLLLLACSVAVAKRWGGIGLPAASLAFLTIPGLVEIGFFFNDNVVSTALGVAALAAASRPGTVPAYAGAGALIGAAVLCRTDAVLLCPGLAGIAWVQHGRWGPLAGRGLAASAGSLLVFLAAYALTGVTVLDALRASSGFFPSSSVPSRTLNALLFLGAPGLVLLCIGVALNVRRRLLGARDIRWSVVFILYPAALAALGVVRFATELRYIFPLAAPFLLVHVGRGLEWLAESLSGAGRSRRLGAAVAAGLILLLLLPPVTFVRDGPHSMIGRMWTPLLWHRWQASVERSMGRIGEVVAAAEASPRLLVLSTQFNDDFYLKLRLLEDGFRVRRAEDAFPGCRGGFSVYGKPGHLVLHVRTENQYNLAPLPRGAVRALLIQRALQCPEVWRFDRAYLTFVGRTAKGTEPPLDSELFGAEVARLPPLDALSTSFAFDPFALLHPSRRNPAAEATPLRLRLGEIYATSLSEMNLKDIQANAERIASEGNARREEGPFTYEDFIALYRRRF